MNKQIAFLCPVVTIRVTLERQTLALSGIGSASGTTQYDYGCSREGSSLISSRLDLRKAILLGQRGKQARLNKLPSDTAKFFMKAPDNNVLEFALSRKVILVEGDAEFILLDALYQKHARSTLKKDGVHVISVGGTGYRRA
jgi:hypothetical protein